MRKIFDISPTIHEGIAVWPGDVKFEKNFSMQLSKGDNLDLGSIRTTLHLGAHADARSHYFAGGETVEAMYLDAYIGECQVIKVGTPYGERILPRHVPGKIKAPRILLRTDSYPHPDHFNTNFCSLSPELIEFLSKQGVQLIGIDTPSVDPFESKKLESHQALQKFSVVNLEGLVLDQVPDGLYFLSALPLKILGADASPVRAVLISES
jgi:arylformamidase